MPDTQSTHCSQCGSLIMGSTTEPCSQCGSLDRTVRVNFSEKLGITATLSVIAQDTLSHIRGSVVNPAVLSVKASLPQGEVGVEDLRPLLALGSLSIRMATPDHPTYQVSIGDEVLEPFEQFDDAIYDLILLIHERHYGT